MKKEIENKYFQAVSKVILYIDENKKEDLNLKEISKISGFSKFHFHRIFKLITGYNIGDYIKKTKIASSTKKFMNFKKVTKIALVSGYGTPAAYGKAFKNVYGKTPKEYFQIIIKENIKNKIMEPIKIENIDDTEVLFVRKEAKNYTEAAGAAFEILMKFAYTNKIKYKKGLMGKNAMVFGISYDDPKLNTKNVRFEACITWDDKTVKPEKEISSKIISGGKYAVFLHKGSYDNLEKTYQEIMVWVAKNKIELKNKPFFEKYLNRDPRRTKEENLRTEIFIPIK